MLNSYQRSGKDFDEWRWNLSSNGRFTTKKLQQIIEEKFLVEGRGGCETLRNNLIPKKVEIFIWRVLHKRLPTLVELDKRGVDLHSVRCPMCDNDVETIEHSLIFCNLAFEIWTRVYKWWGVGPYTNLSLAESFGGNTNATTTVIGSKIWQAVTWTCGYMVWKNRNNKIFRNKVWCSPIVVNEIQIISFDWISRRIKGIHLDWHTWLDNPSVYLCAK
ncbi:uncharacterized protein [Rutidosis leptorrhynchoides]|uniref:uncharacterized protein n=1 Tax=Rutidosis leptorrhynchoides TaxID=125765 RepID=UPI003A997BBC